MFFNIIIDVLCSLSFNQTSASEQSRFLCAGYSSGRITLWAVACDGEGGAQERFQLYTI